MHRICLSFPVICVPGLSPCGQGSLAAAACVSRAFVDAALPWRRYYRPGKSLSFTVRHREVQFVQGVNSDGRRPPSFLRRRSPGVIIAAAFSEKRLHRRRCCFLRFCSADIWSSLVLVFKDSCLLFADRWY